MDSNHSKHLANRIDAQSKECFSNSIKALWYDPSLVYCEGHCIINLDIPIEHGWLEKQNGTVVDVTLWENPPVDYYVCCRYTKQEIEEILNTQEEIVVPLSSHVEFAYSMFKAHYQHLGMDLTKLF